MISDETEAALVHRAALWLNEQDRVFFEHMADAKTWLQVPPTSIINATHARYPGGWDAFCDHVAQAEAVS